MSAFETSLPASLRKALRFGMGLYGLFIIWASLRPAGTGGAIPHLDKVLHALVYGILALGLALAWPKLSKLRIWIGCALFGGAMEIMQGAMAQSRTASFWDALANGVGAAVAMIVLIWISRKFAP